MWAGVGRLTADPPPVTGLLAIGLVFVFITGPHVAEEPSGTGEQYLCRSGLEPELPLSLGRR